MKRQLFTFIALTIFAIKTYAVSDRTLRSELKSACARELINTPDLPSLNLNYRVRLPEDPNRPSSAPSLDESFKSVSAKKIDSYWSNRKSISQLRGLLTTWYKMRLAYYQKKNNSKIPSAQAGTLAQATALVEPKLWATEAIESKAADREKLLAPLRTAIEEYRNLKTEAQKLINIGFMAYVSERILIETSKFETPTEEKPLVIENFPVAEGETIRFKTTKEVVLNKIDLKERIQFYQSERKRIFGEFLTRGEFDKLESNQADKLEVISVYRLAFRKAQLEGTLSAELETLLGEIDLLVGDSQLQPTSLARLLLSQKLFQAEKARFESVQNGEADTFYQTANANLTAVLGGLYSPEKIEEISKQMGLNKVSKLKDSIVTAASERIVKLIRSTFWPAVLTTALGSGVTVYSQRDHVGVYIDEAGEFLKDHVVLKIDEVFGYNGQIDIIARSDNYARESSEFFAKYFTDVANHIADPTKPVLQERFDEAQTILMKLETAHLKYLGEKFDKELSDAEKAQAAKDFAKLTEFLINQVSLHNFRALYFALDEDRTQGHAKLFVQFINDLIADQNLTDEEKLNLEKWYRFGLNENSPPPELTASTRTEFIHKMIWFKAEYMKERQLRPGKSRADIVNTLLKLSYSQP